MGFGPNVIGAIQDSTDGFAYVSLTLAGLSAVGIITAFILIFLDYSLNGGVLQKPATSGEQAEEQELIDEYNNLSPNARDKLKKSVTRSIAKASVAR